MAKKIEKENAEFLAESAKALTVPRLTPYDPDRPFNSEVNFRELEMLMQMGVVVMLESGVRLCERRANLPHGEFRDDLDRLGLPHSTAYRWMNTAEKLASMPSLEASKVTMKKAYALAEELDQEDMKLLEAGEKVRGVSLDDVDRMTPKELRKALRKEREKRKSLAAETDALHDQIDEIKGAKAPPVMSDRLLQSFGAVCNAVAGLVLVCESEEGREELDQVVTDDGQVYADRLYNMLSVQLDRARNAIRPPLFVRRQPEDNDVPAARAGGKSRAS